MKNIQKTAAHPLAQTVAELRSGHRDLEEYVAVCCKRIEEWDGDIRAMLPESNRLQRLLDDAVRLTAVASDEIPPLFGVLIAVKDIFHVEGFETRAGSGVSPEVLTGSRRRVLKGVAGGGCACSGQSGYDGVCVF